MTDPIRVERLCDACHGRGTVPCEPITNVIGKLVQARLVDDRTMCTKCEGKGRTTAVATLTGACIEKKHPGPSAC